MKSESERLQWLARHILPYEGKVRSWLTRHVRTIAVADADDLIQEAYARIWVLDTELIQHPRAYFSMIVKNLVAEHARRSKIVPMERMGEIEALTIVSEEPGPERHASARAELEELRTQLATLPVQCRRAFELRKFDGLTIQQTAGILAISDSAVEKLLARALSRILEMRRQAYTSMASDNETPRERAREQR